MTQQLLANYSWVRNTLLVDYILTEPLGASILGLQISPDHVWRRGNSEQHLYVFETNMIRKLWPSLFLAWYFPHYLMADKRGQRVRRRDINLKFPIGGDSCTQYCLLLWATKIFFWLADGQKMHAPLCASVLSVSACILTYIDIFF